MNQSTFKKYEINNITSGDVVSSFYDDVGDGVFASNPFRIRYLQVGKLYFGIWGGATAAGPGGFAYVVLGDGQVPANMAAAVARLAFILGITVDTAYYGNIYNAGGSPRTQFWNGVAWTQANPNESQFITAILAA